MSDEINQEVSAAIESLNAPEVQEVREESPEDVARALLAGDAGREHRQLHMVDAQGRIAAHTGSAQAIRPSAGAWVSYGLGTENRNLPSFMVLAPAAPYAGAPTWGSDFLPACHQGTHVIPGKEPLPNLKPNTPAAELQEMELGLLGKLNRAHLERRAADAALGGYPPISLPAEFADQVAGYVETARGYGPQGAAYLSNHRGHLMFGRADERPFLSAEDETPLEPGMTFTDEPSIIVPGRFSIRIENVIVCAEGGGRVLNEHDDGLIVVSR